MALFDETLHGRDDEMDDYGEGNAYDETPEEEEDYDEEEEEEEDVEEEGHGHGGHGVESIFEDEGSRRLDVTKG